MAGTAALGLFRELRTQPVRNRPRTSRRGQVRHRPVAMSPASTGPPWPAHSPRATSVAMHVNPRDALIQHLHLRGHLLQRHPPRTGTRHAARQSPGQYRRLTHAHAAATGVTRHGAPAPNLSTASNGPSETGDDERHASTTMHFPPRPAIARPHGKRPQPPATRTGRRRRGPSCRIPRQRHAVANEFLLAWLQDPWRWFPAH